MANKNSKTNKQSVDRLSLMINGQSYTLVCSPKAAARISQHFNGFRSALDRVMNMDTNAMTYILRQGLGKSDGEVKWCAEAVYNIGAVEMMVPLSNYLSFLMNGGRDPEAETEDADALIDKHIGGGRDDEDEGDSPNDE